MTRTYELPVGTQVSVRNSGKADESQTFEAQVEREFEPIGHVTRAGIAVLTSGCRQVQTLRRETE